jgi:hypothetical protein
MDFNRNYFDDDSNVKLKLSDFDFQLPQQLIAQYPLREREESRMIVLNRRNRKIAHRKFKDFVEYLHPGDCLVIKNRRKGRSVFAAEPGKRYLGSDGETCPQSKAG